MTKLVLLYGFLLALPIICASRTAPSPSPVSHIFSGLTNYTKRAQRKFATGLDKLLEHTHTAVDSGIAAFKDYSSFHVDPSVISPHLAKLSLYEAQLQELSGELKELTVEARSVVEDELIASSKMSNYMSGMLEEYDRGDREGTLLHLKAAISEVDGMRQAVQAFSHQHSRITAKVKEVRHCYFLLFFI